MTKHMQISVFELITFLGSSSDLFPSSSGRGYLRRRKTTTRDSPDSTLQVCSSKNIVASGEIVAPIPKKNPTITNQNSGLSFSKILIVRLKTRIYVDTNSSPEKYNIVVKLITLRLRLQMNRLSERRTQQQMKIVWVVKRLAAYFIARLPEASATDLTMKRKEQQVQSWPEDQLQQGISTPKEVMNHPASMQEQSRMQNIILQCCISLPSNYISGLYHCTFLSYSV